MRTVIASVLGVLLATGPLAAQQSTFSLARAAREEAVRQAAASPARAPMSPAFKWTGLGMLIGGGALLATGILVDNACIENGEHDLEYCEDLQTAWFATGGAIAAGGGAVLLVGNGKRQSLPAVNLGARRVTWRVRF